MDHVIIGTDRFIRVPESLKKIAVQYDHNVKTVTFDCPRYWNDGVIDLLNMKIYIIYMRADGAPSSFIATNVYADAFDPAILHFDWTLSRNATTINGPLVFKVCARAVDENGDITNHWNSENNTEMIVSEGLETSDSVIFRDPDFMTQVLARLDYFEDKLVGYDNEPDITRVTANCNNEARTLTVVDGVVYNVVNCTILTIAVPEGDYTSHLFIKFSPDASEVGIVLPAGVNVYGTDITIVEPGDYWELGIDSVGGILSLRTRVG